MFPLKHEPVGVFPPYAGPADVAIAGKDVEKRYISRLGSPVSDRVLLFSFSSLLSLLFIFNA